MSENATENANETETEDVSSFSIFSTRIHILCLSDKTRHTHLIPGAK